MPETRYFKCVDDPDHVIAIDLSEDSFKKLSKKFKKGYRSCPTCKLRIPPENNCMIPCEPPETESKFSGGYTFVACRHGHMTRISAFSNGTLHIKWGNDEGQFENIPGTPEDIAEILDSKSISCNHTIERKRGWARCGCKIKTVVGRADIPSPIAIKTKIRVGDIWDKEGAAHPTKGNYDDDGYYKPTEFERRNARRMKDMKSGKIEVFDEKTGKRKFVRRKRVSKEKGTPITRSSHIDKKTVMAARPEISSRQAKKDE